MLKITNRKEGKSVPNAKKRKPLTSVSLFLSVGNRHPYPDAVPVTMTSTGMLPMEEGTGKD